MVAGKTGRVRQFRRPRPCAPALIPWTLAALLTAVTAAPAERFPEIKPATRVQAVTTLSGGTSLPVRCLTPRLQSMRSASGPMPAPARRALSLVRGSTILPAEQRRVAPDGTVIRFTLDSGSFDRVPSPDIDGDGTPDVVQEALQSVEEARRLLEGLAFPTPGPVDIVLADIGGRFDGYALPAATARGRPLLVLSARPARGTQSVGEAAAHQYAHVTAAATGAVPAGWSEALAHWVVARLEGRPGPDLLDLMSRRLARMSEGLFVEDLGLAAGNALWLSFMEESFGPASVRLAIEELATGDPPPMAMDRAVRRAAGQSLEEAFREFSLWSVLVGSRDDGRHFSFARGLSSPAFASIAEGMPALSVHSDPPVLPLGAAGILVRPEETEGGLTVVFEGDLSGLWEADLLLFRTDGTLHRVPMPVNPAARAELTVPLNRLAEAVLLVRNLGGQDAWGRRYTWSVHRERGFPYELGSLEAGASEPFRGVLVSWETLSETRLLGFNVLRQHEETGEIERVNPIWVPAVGDGATPVSYQFLDAGAEPDVSYLYRVEGVTVEGLTSVSDLAANTPPASR